MIKASEYHSENVGYVTPRNKAEKREPKQIDEFCCSFFEMFKTSKNSLYRILFVAMKTGTHVRNFD